MTQIDPRSAAAISRARPIVLTILVALGVAACGGTGQITAPRPALDVAGSSTPVAPAPGPFEGN